MQIIGRESQNVRPIDIRHHFPSSPIFPEPCLLHGPQEINGYEDDDMFLGGLNNFHGEIVTQ